MKGCHIHEFEDSQIDADTYSPEIRVMSGEMSYPTRLSPTCLRSDALSLSPNFLSVFEKNVLIRRN